MCFSPKDNFFSGLSNKFTYGKHKNTNPLNFLIFHFRYFPYDQQNCTLTISSWTNSKSALDYYADPEVNFASFISNEEWDVMSFRIFRHEVN